MARRGLEDRIEAWPEQWKEARTRYVEAKALVAKLDLQLERAKQRALARDEMENSEDSVAVTPALLQADQHLLELDFEVQRLTFAVERAKAEADVRTRAAAQAAGQKLTEAAVEARVKSDANYVASQEKLLDAKQRQALAKLERDQQARLEREQRRYGPINDVIEEEPETEEMVKLRSELDAAYRQLEHARTDLAYQAKVGQALQMLTEVLKADSVVVAAVPLGTR